MEPASKCARVGKCMCWWYVVVVVAALCPRRQENKIKNEG